MRITFNSPRYKNLEIFLNKEYSSHFSFNGVKAIFTFELGGASDDYCKCYKVYGIPSGKKKVLLHLK